MAIPDWTPDGETVNINKVPSNHQLAGLTCKDDGMVAEMDISALSPRPQFLIFDTAVRIVLVEAV